MRWFAHGVINFPPILIKEVIKKRERKSKDKWHLDEMTIRINGEYFILWRAVDSDGYELNVLLQKRRNKKSAIRFLTRLLGHCPITIDRNQDQANFYERIA